MKAVNNYVMSEIDRNAQEKYSYPALLLMENAGISCWKYLENNVFPEKSSSLAVFVCGRGNNGGDALVMARHNLSAGKKGIIIISGKITREGPAKINFDICGKLGIEIYDWSVNPEKCRNILNDADIIIDGIAGTGITKGALKGNEAELAEYINTLKACICSIDTPSGTGENYRTEDPAVNADITLTIGLPKTALYTPAVRKKCGIIAVADASFPPELIENADSDYEILDDSAISDLLTMPEPWLYKNQRGHAAVFAGSAGTSGAAILASSAALKSLAGLVTLYTDKNIYQSIMGSFKSVMVKPFIHDEQLLPESFLSGRYSSFIIGPGWGICSENREWLKWFLENSTVPTVLDADALTMLSELIKSGLKIKNKNCIVTPHIGEFSRMTGVSSKSIMENPAPVMKEYSAETGFIIVLKSYVTWIYNPSGQFTISDRMNPALGTAGSGDVLSGIIGGLLAYGLSPGKAAAAGVLIHSEAGKQCYNRKGYFTSDQLIEFVQKTIKKHCRDWQNCR